MNKMIKMIKILNLMSLKVKYFNKKHKILARYQINNKVNRNNHLNNRKIKQI